MEDAKHIHFGCHRFTHERTVLERIANLVPLTLRGDPWKGKEEDQPLGGQLLR